MKRRKKIVLFLILIITFSVILPTKKITTNIKKVYSSGNNSVSTRELAMLASIVYEDVPDDSRYEGNTAGKGCTIKSDGSVTAKDGTDNCIFGQYDGDTKLKGSKYYIKYYVEGMSERKINSLVSFATAAFQEDGQSYYWLNYADISELNNWKIVHAGNQNTKVLFKNSGIDFDWNATFSAITFKKGNNYVIAYRGTDYQDLAEWAYDIGYSGKGKHKETDLASVYAVEEYNRIIKSDPNAKIYVTGHSLGGYLAQVGGAGIINSLNNVSENDAPEKTYNTMEELEEKYTKAASNLVQVAYFNGMGVNGVFTSSDYSRNAGNALLYLSTHNSNGTRSTLSRYVNYSDSISSSGRLVLYSMDGDPVSDIGIHYGEIYKLNVGADAISNHHETHDTVTGSAGIGIEVLFNILAKGENKTKKIVEILDEYIAENNLDKKYSYNIIDSISENVYNLINLDEITSNTVFDFLPGVVDNEIKRVYGTRIYNYELGDVISAISSDVNTFSTKYKNVEIKNLFDHFNMNHETDSFMCVRDKSNGQITKDNIVISAISNKMKCTSDNKCYTNGNYTIYNKLGGSKYEIGKSVNDQNGNFIILTATVTSGCAKSYSWYYSTDGSNYISLGEPTIKNKIIIPKDIIDTAKDTSKSVMFKVIVNYGDEFIETKLNYTKATDKFGYKKITSNILSKNPTLSEDSEFAFKDSNNVESNPIEVTLTKDTKEPVCRFTNTSVEIERGQNKNLEIVCEDDSPIDFSSLKTKYVSKSTFKEIFTSTGFETYVNCSTENDINKKCAVNVQAKDFKLINNYDNNPYFVGSVKDYAGNKSTEFKTEIERVKNESSVDTGK